MSEFTQFENPTPITIPPVAAKVYDKFWLRLLTIAAPSTSAEASLYAEFQPCRDLTDANGNPIGKELKPEQDGDIKVVRCDSLMTLAASDTEMATAMESVFIALKKYGAAQGVFPTPTP